MTETATEPKCGRLMMAEGRVCDKPAVGIYQGIAHAGETPVCQQHADALYRAWGIRVRPLNTRTSAEA